MEEEKVRKLKLMSGLLTALLVSGVAHATTITIAANNNGDMVRMQKLSSDFTAKNPDIELRWVILDEGTLRQKVTTAIATKSGIYDVINIGNYEVPIWAKQKWIEPLDNLGSDFDVDDLLPAIRASLSVDGKLYGSPFYGESAITMYRPSLFKKAGLTMPENPTWEFIKEAADKITDKNEGVYGICLRGKAGWGENMAFVTALANSWGGQWFDMKWRPQFDGQKWKEAAEFYVDLMKKDGPPGSSSNSFNENLALFQSGKCGMWMDASVAASFVSDPKQSNVANDVAYALFPTHGELKNHGNWLWAWSLAIPTGSKNTEAAQKFVNWATNRDYLSLVAGKEGWANVPPGTRSSLYANPDYQKAAPFSDLTLKAMNAADTQHPSVEPTPYTGGQFVSIPEFQGIGTAVGQQFSAALAGQETVEQALSKSQEITKREMVKAGYIK
ncbi:extracellular solute-binding protein [Rhizobium lusitanum]|uniref:Extracellular solute-binding protein n=2 Tax=Rhizobium lusitanum TaxID=293958 RepID=A0A6L9UM26_9HYPH|nr:extracellular solute-binding protein [Rhizobium lusitanum]